ncbi:uncharacterized protein LOC126880982 [Diabrotica virgifera virgifera]|uniref:Uncharacterized protein n=1 Tax=Diabrotica virgifera virgifera TaxID=50390 RepID=A0ABM5JSV3_DIAVI|nr:uncharacterized protein LOC126880982 [Diabrotica virgifera virgifera]
MSVLLKFERDANANRPGRRDRDLKPGMIIVCILALSLISNVLSKPGIGFSDFFGIAEKLSDTFDQEKFSEVITELHDTIKQGITEAKERMASLDKKVAEAEEKAEEGEQAEEKAEEKDEDKAEVEDKD